MSTAENVPGDMQGLRDQLVMALLPHVPFEGWTARALREAAKDAGYDPTMGERAFPEGPAQAVEHFADLADRQLAKDAASANLEGLGVGQRIGWLVRRRLEAWAEHQEAIRRGVSLLSLPNNAGRALRATWRTVDTLWYAAGDVSADFSYYTRRATLSAIYTATLLCWLDDKSEGFADSWDFLQRRLNDARQLPTLRRQVEQQLAGLTFPLNGLKGSLFKTRSRLKFGVKR